MKLDDSHRFMNYEELATRVRGFGYKPGWTFDVYNDPWEGPFLYVRVTMPDAYNPGQEITLGVRSNIPPMRNHEDLTNWLLWRIMQMEIHECLEFFTFYGKRVRDPHDPLEP
jgi:hypothetical protein